MKARSEQLREIKNTFNKLFRSSPMFDSIEIVRMGEHAHLTDDLPLEVSITETPSGKWIREETHNYGVRVMQVFRTRAEAENAKKGEHQ